MGVAIQRGLREQEAWVAMVHARRGSIPDSVERLRAMPMPLANDSLIGVWVNGLEERTVLIFMALAIPCFIIHEYEGSSELTRDIVHPSVPSFVDFLDGTDANEILSQNTYELTARANPFQLDAIYVPDQATLLSVATTQQDRLRSSTLYLENLSPPRRQRHVMMTAAAQKAAAREEAVAREAARDGKGGTAATASRAPSSQPAAGTPARLSSQSAAAITARMGSAEGLSLAPRSANIPPPVYALPAPNASADRYTPREVETRTIHLERVPFIVPPRIPPNWTRGWDKYELDFVEGEKAWIHRGNKYQIEASKVWFDRERGRRLYFGIHHTPAGLLDEDRFGAPVPRHPFYVRSGDHYRPQVGSFWMYPSERAIPGDVGRVAKDPAPERLPHLDVNRREVPRRQGGKGKGRAENEDDSEYSEEDDEYGAEASFTAAPDEGYCFPSNVITIDGLDGSISAIMFRALASNVLFAIRVEPLSILRAQGLMWMRFEDAAAGQAALGAMGTVAQGLVVSYRPDEEYSDATTYSRDVWNRPLGATLGETGLDPSFVPPLPYTNNATASPVQVSAPLGVAPAADEDVEMDRAIALSLDEPWKEAANASRTQGTVKRAQGPRASSNSSRTSLAPSPPASTSPSSESSEGAVVETSLSIAPPSSAVLPSTGKPGRVAAPVFPGPLRNMLAGDELASH
ncbi:hypothetical protein MSAN_01602400 [Mycena sanguinolenta]|uniref:Uncharacterized protein n=1 Tax=Mycena sanguinolenta TaxID=230812 RepID=A0A8H6Y4E0_9AGAR|nr:hypothetical protein MSAN_01602400 [Mycena sanguinolenta]